MNPILCRALARPGLGAAFVLASSLAAADPAKCRYTPIGKLPLRYSGPSLEITTQGTINGTPAEPLVDTGMYRTALTRTGTERRGIRAYATGRRATGIGIGGMSPIYASIVNEFIVGPVRALPVPDRRRNLAGGEGTDLLRARTLRRHDQNHMNPQFLVRINGKELEAMIDSGAAVSSITAHAEIAVVDSGLNEVDVTLGADFLRAHRVLFAMSQTKLYFSYVGGEPFGQGRTLEPWIVAEAESGNADAQMTLAEAYGRGKLVGRDDARAFDWLEKAAKGGSARANLLTGRNLVLRRDYAAAVPRLRTALDKLPAERDGALLLYIARVRNGQPDLAKSELAAIFARSDSDEWPKPIADFYLGARS